MVSLILAGCTDYYIFVYRCCKHQLNRILCSPLASHETFLFFGRGSIFRLVKRILILDIPYF